MDRRKWLSFCMALLLALAPALPAETQNAAGPGDEARRALHALNRLAYGPRPGEVERVAAMGVERWIEQQLDTRHIDDGALQARLRQYVTLNMSTAELLEAFPPPQMLRRIAEGRAPLPTDPRQRAVYEAQMERFRSFQQMQGQEQDARRPGMAAEENSMAPAPMEEGMAPGREMMGGEMNPARRAALREARWAAQPKAQALVALPAGQRMDAILKMPAQERRVVLGALTFDQRQQMMEEFSPENRVTVLALLAPNAAMAGELQQAKLLRAIHSERQLLEVMTDFWFNHFNVFMNKGLDRHLVTAYERDVIRPHALGRFGDLLQATATSPAMLFYLDNWQSVGPQSQFARGAGRGGNRARRGPLARRAVQRRLPPGMTEEEARERMEQVRQQRRGLNENYARELLELHTLGVDGGYTQADVTELARVFTGWTLRPQQGEFVFQAAMHEPGEKTVLGMKVKDAGQREGERVLAMLATHPSTARFISRKLAQRFVADEPPAELVERMAQTFTRTGGDIREVLRTLFRAPEFWSPEAYRAKVKTPLEFVVSAVRATGAEVRNPQPLVQALNQMGMPLYLAQPPTGYAMTAETWVNSAALLKRMNFALALGNGRLPGLRAAPAAGGSAEETLARLEEALLGGQASEQTRAVIRKQMEEAQTPAGAGLMTGFLLGSADFQRR